MRTVFSDPDASWGDHGATSTRGSGGFYGYKPHTQLCNKRGWQMAWELDTAKASELPHVPTLHADSREHEFVMSTGALDKGYDYAPTGKALQVERLRRGRVLATRPSRPATPTAPNARVLTEGKTRGGRPFQPCDPAQSRRPR